MREYKFRGKRIDNGEWVYGYVYKDALIGCNILQTKPCLAAIMVDPSTAGQYTGLKDKNGREIYEGDILEEEPGYYFEVIWSVECAKFKLQWRTKAIQYPEWNRGVNMTVIGNRWDNPELLKEGGV
jgi:uncharacterized phage protein (TIGR01671 family)